MRSIRLPATPSLSTLVVEEEAEPAPGPGEVVVRIHASSLNFHDYLIVAGHLPVAPGRIPMSDGAGEIVAAGKDVPPSVIGDRVMGTFFPLWRDGAPDRSINDAISGESVDGFAAERISVALNSLTAIPKGYSFAEAATLPCAAVTAWRALVVEGQLQPGNHVVIMGTGGLSMFAVQLANLLGIRTIVLSGADEKFDRARALGADHLINYRATPDWARQVMAYTDGRGADLVMEVGGTSSFAQSTLACRVGGKILLIGTLGQAAPTPDFKHIVMNHIRIDGMAVGNRAHQEALVSFIDKHSLKPVIDRDFALDELGGAFTYQLQQKHVGKITVSI